MSGIVLYGDPHGEWRPLLRACAEDRPDAAVILGDCDLDMPLRRRLAPLVEAGVRILWIPGNHDADTPERHDFLWGDHPAGNLHGRAEHVGGVTAAGLGGVFKERVWYPRLGMPEPAFRNARHYLGTVSRDGRWRGGLPLRMRDTLWPDDAASLGRFRADVLVTHEAPSCHRHGFIGIDAAAAACRARLIVHGHHHESVSGVLPDGTPVQGLTKAEVLRLAREDFA